MDLQEFLKKFRSFPSKEKGRFLLENICLLQEKEKIAFLLSVVKEKKYSSHVRASALHALGQTSFSEESFFHELTSDHDPEIAAAAEKALKEWKSKNSKKQHISQIVLRKIRSCIEKEKKLKVIKSVTHVKDSWVDEVLLEALADPSEEIRDFIIQELGKREHLSPNVIYPRLFRPPWYVKSSVLKILAIQKNPRSIQLIRTVINDSNAEVRCSAAAALGEIGGEEALVLLNKLAKDSNRFVRKSAEEALSKASRLKFS